MIVRDWQRLAWNVLVGPPLAYVIGLVCLCLMLGIPPLLRGADASLVMIVLIVGMPAIPLAYLFGGVPFLLIGIATCILARFIRGEAARIWIAVPLGALPFWWLATVMIGPQRQFDSADLNNMLIASAPIGGAVAAAACAWLSERFGSRKGLPEDYL
jgi:hypothetical protein